MTKKKRYLLVGGIVVAILAAVALYAHWLGLQRTYYPMEGEVTVLEKVTEEDAYFLRIQEIAGGEAVQFLLACTPEQFYAVDVGDEIHCARTQSMRFDDGTLEIIYTINGKKLEK